MKHPKSFFRRFRVLLLPAACCVLLFAGCDRKSSSPSPRYRIWFKEPAKIWEATLPLGNGHLGMMPGGQTGQETIVLNDITLWSGGVQDADNPDAARHLPEIRRLLFEGKNDKAQELVYNTFVCKGAGSGRGLGAKVPYGSFEVLGNLHLRYDNDTLSPPEDYRRWLDLDNATAFTRYTAGGITHHREYFVSFAGDVGIIRLWASEKGQVNVTIGLDRPEKYETCAEGSRLTMAGQLENGTDGKGMRYQVLVEARNRGGELTVENNTLVVKGASELLLVVSAATDYKNPGFIEKAGQALERATSQSYAKLKRAHTAAYKALFDRMELSLSANPQREALSTPERLAAFAGDPDDNGLVELYFQYGRYLLISSAHAGLLPPNLQGLWARTVQTPWNGDYHLNINVQMNHWPAEVTNLAELHRPLIEFTKSLVEPGTRTARIFYNAEGWVAHMMTNVWGFTAPGEHPSWGATNTGGAWLCAHLWEHYDYSRDTAYLREVYPVLKGASRFFLDMLVPEPGEGWLVTAPTTSPENAFLMPGTRTPVHVCMGSTMDNQLIRELFGNTAAAAALLGEEEEFTRQLAEASAKLPPNRIGSDGRLMEWLEEYEEQDPHHRHSSHLYGLHPGNQITPGQTPGLAEAVKKTLESRGDGGTGWSRAWKINFRARLHDGNHAFALLRNLLDPVYDAGYNYTPKGGTYPNLFCAHPPFQMDGNWGGCAGIAEMFLQSHAGFIHLLPALPDRFAEGSFRGMRARGGFTVSAAWKENKAVNAVVDASCDGPMRLHMPAGTTGASATLNGKNTTPAREGDLLSLEMKKGDRLKLVFN